MGVFTKGISWLMWNLVERWDDLRDPEWGRVQRVVALNESLAPPLALTDQHVSALEKAIRAEGFDIFADPETGDIKLERVK